MRSAHGTLPVVAVLAQPLGSSRSICFPPFQETPHSPACPAETDHETRESRFWIFLPDMGNKISQKDDGEAVLSVKSLSLVFAVFVVSTAGNVKEDGPLCAARTTKKNANSVTHFYHNSH